jgi:phosphatidylglycerophosphatase A
MIGIHKVIASVFGLGFIKGGGTLAAILCCLLWLLLPRDQSAMWWQLLLTVLITALGIWSGNVVDAYWGKDSSKVVIDEIAGMMVTLLFFPVEWKYVLAGLILFRIFDIVKPFYIKKAELLPKGIGVMADDMLAGVYAHFVLMIIVQFNLF